MIFPIINSNIFVKIKHLFFSLSSSCAIGCKKKKNRGGKFGNFRLVHFAFDVDFFGVILFIAYKSKNQKMGCYHSRALHIHKYRILFFINFFLSKDG